MSSLRYLERGFQGVDTYVAPSELLPGFLTQCDNLRVDGGDLVTRPGLQGCLAMPHAQPVYGLLARVRTDTGGTELLYSAEGKLYRNIIDGTPPALATASTEILEETSGGDASFALNSPGVFLERAGQYVYGVDGLGPLFRLSDGTAEAVVGLTASTSKLPTALTSRVLGDDFNRNGEWSYSIPASTVNQIADGTFNASGDASPVASDGYWTRYRIGEGESAITESRTYSGFPGNFVQMDDTPSAFKTTNPIPNVRVQELGHDTHPVRYATRFVFSCLYTAKRVTPNDPTRTDTGLFSMEVYDGGGTAITTRSLPPQAATATGQVLPWSGVFDFSDLETEIHSYRLFVQVLNTVGGTGGPYIGNVSLAPLDPKIQFTDAGRLISVKAPVNSDTNTVPLAGTVLIKDLGGSVDLSQESHVEIGLNQIAGFTNFQGVLGFRTGTGVSGDTTVYSNPFHLTPDGKAITVDISTLAPADLTAVRYLEVIFTSDLFVSSGSGGVLFQLGPFASAGNLTVGRADYAYLYTEVKDETPVSSTAPLSVLLESNPSPYSNALTPTDTQATALLTLPSTKINSTATHFRLYRIGGVFADGLARLVGTWLFGPDSVSVDNPDRLATYDHSAGTVTDNVPDSDLLGETTVADFGRDKLPDGAHALAFFQGRLAAAVKSVFYWSWLVDSDGAAGLYFNQVLDPGDPNAAIKGGVFPVGGDDNDPITRFDPFASQLVIEKSRSVWLGVGSDALDLRVQQYLSSQGVGCVAKRGGGKVGNHVWMRGADSLYQFDADTVDDVGTNIERSLNPAAQDDAFVYHGRRGFWITRSPGASANDAAWVWDTRTEQYVRFLQFAVTGGVSLAAGENGDGAYFGGLDGQVYQLTGSADRATPTATPTAISWAVTTRAFGAETGREVTGTHVLCEVSVQQATAFTLTASEDGGAGRSASVPYSVSGAGEYRLRLRLPPGKARGRALTVTVAGASTLPLRLQAVGLEAVTGARD